MTRTMSFLVGHDHPILPGHFPGHPIVPGVVLLDRVFAAIEATHGPLGAVRLPQVKFLQPLLPGETAQVELQRVDADDAARFRFRVLRGEDVLVSGEVIAASADAGMSP